MVAAGRVAAYGKTNRRGLAFASCQANAKSQAADERRWDMSESDLGPARKRPKRSRKKPKYSKDVQDYVAFMERRAGQDERKPSRHRRVPVDLILGVLFVAAGVLVFVFAMNAQPAQEDGNVLAPGGLMQEADRMVRTIVIAGICFTLVGLGALCLWKGGGSRYGHGGGGDDDGGVE